MTSVCSSGSPSYRCYWQADYSCSDPSICFFALITSHYPAPTCRLKSPSSCAFATEMHFTRGFPACARGLLPSLLHGTVQNDLLKWTSHPITPLLTPPVVPAGCGLWSPRPSPAPTLPLPPTPAFQASLRLGSAGLSPPPASALAVPVFLQQVTSSSAVFGSLGPSWTLCFHFQPNPHSFIPPFPT